MSQRSFWFQFGLITWYSLRAKDTDITSHWNFLVVSLWTLATRHAGHKWYILLSRLYLFRIQVTAWISWVFEWIAEAIASVVAVSMWQSCGRWRIHIFTGVVLCICHVCYGNAPLALPLSPLLWSTLSRFTCHFRRWAVSVRFPSASQHSAIRQDVHVRLVCQENGPTFHQQRPESQETPASNNGRKVCYLFWQITNIFIIFVTFSFQSGLFIKA